MAAEALDSVPCEPFRRLGGGDRGDGLAHRRGRLGEGNPAGGGLDEGLGRDAAGEGALTADLSLGDQQRARPRGGPGPGGG